VRRVGRSAEKGDKEPGERLGSSGLMERLHSVRKRKQAYSGQMVDAEAVKRLLREEERRSRGG
jgi:hypothetical protein